MRRALGRTGFAGFVASTWCSSYAGSDREERLDHLRGKAADIRQVEVQADVNEGATANAPCGALSEPVTAPELQR